MTIAFLLLMAGAIFSNSLSFGQRKSTTAVVVSNGVQFQIPPGYVEHKGKDRSTVIFEPPKGSHTFALIKVYFEHRETDIPGHDLTQEKMELFGLSKTGDRKANLSGRSGGCVEYSVKTKSGVAIAQAECSFGTELHTSFFGEPQNLRVFYAFMQAAEPARKDPQL
jgi:hypothetical protein